MLVLVQSILIVMVSFGCNSGTCTVANTVSAKLNVRLSDKISWPPKAGEIADVTFENSAETEFV